VRVFCLETLGSAGGGQVFFLGGFRDAHCSCFVRDFHAQGPFVGPGLCCHQDVNLVTCSGLSLGDSEGLCINGSKISHYQANASDSSYPMPNMPFRHPFQMDVMY